MYTPQQNQQRNSYAASANSTNQPRYFQQPHHPSQYAPYPQAKSPGGPINRSGDSGLESQMIAAHHAIIMDRGRQPIAQQTKQEPGTPQPVTGLPGPERRSATPGGGQQNGTAVTGGQ